MKEAKNVRKDWLCYFKADANMKVFQKDLGLSNEIDVKVLQALEPLEQKLPEHMVGMLSCLLQGYEVEVQVQMVNNMIQFTEHRHAIFTGIFSIDCMLEHAYLLIGVFLGIVKKEFVYDLMNYSN